MPEDLEKVLLERFRFPVEIMYLRPYQGDQGDRAYSYEPFLADIESPSLNPGEPQRRPVNPAELDTIVVPARSEGFRTTFLGENRWYAIRIHASMRDQIRWIAAYQVAPISAITHVAPVRSVEPWGDSGKFVVNFEAAAQEIDPSALLDTGESQEFKDPVHDKGPPRRSKKRNRLVVSIFHHSAARMPTIPHTPCRNGQSC